MGRGNGVRNAIVSVCCFVALFVFWFVDIQPENQFFTPRPGLEVNPLGVYPLRPRSSSCGPTKGTPPPRITPGSTCQLRLTLNKLTGWLASLDLRKPYTHASSFNE